VLKKEILRAWRKQYKKIFQEKFSQKGYPEYQHWKDDQKRQMTKEFFVGTLFGIL